MLGQYIVEGKDDVAFMFKNNTILANYDGFKDLKPSSDIYIDEIRFSTTQSGYLEDKELYFSLLNVGRKYGEEDYTHILRLVSDTQNYDVIIPYYLDHLTYDAVTEKIICIVCDVEFPNQYFLRYMVLNFDDATGKFVLDENLYEIPYNENRYYNKSIVSDTGFRSNLANNNYLYSVSEVDTEEFVNKYKGIDNRGNDMYKNLILTTFDLKKGTSTDTILKKNILLVDLTMG